MSDFFQPSSLERFIITLDIEPENPRDSGPAWVDAIRRDTEDALQHDGYIVLYPFTQEHVTSCLSRLLPLSHSHTTYG